MKSRFNVRTVGAALAKRIHDEAATCHPDKSREQVDQIVLATLRDAVAKMEARRAAGR